MRIQRTDDESEEDGDDSGELDMDDKKESDDSETEETDTGGMKIQKILRMNLMTMNPSEEDFNSPTKNYHQG